MTPTEELRAKLDERGVEYRIDDAKTVRATEWEFGEHSSAMFTEYDDGGCVFVASGHTWTPEQAIAATVGEEHEMHICKRCGVAYELNIIDKGFGKPRFCPNCGHKELYQ